MLESKWNAQVNGDEWAFELCLVRGKQYENKEWCWNSWGWEEPGSKMVLLTFESDGEEYAEGYDDEELIDEDREQLKLVKPQIKRLKKEAQKIADFMNKNDITLELKES